MMRDCVDAEMRDRLPELLHGRLDGATRAVVEAHVAVCADCAAELTLLRTAARAITRAAPAVDVARIAAAVRAAVPVSPAATGADVIPLRPVARSARPGARTWRIAAAAALLAGAGSWFALRETEVAPMRDVATVTAAPAPSASAPASSPAPAVIAATDDGAPAPPRSVAGDGAQLAVASLSDDLTDAELAQLVRQLEQLDALPTSGDPSTLAEELSVVNALGRDG